MRRAEVAVFLFILATLDASSASAQDLSGTVRRWPEAQGLTRAAPTASCLATSNPEGMDQRTVRGLRVMLEAPSGQTLTGGTLLAWHYDFVAGVWFRNPANDLTVTSGLAAQVWGDLPVAVRTGCVLYATSSVTLSGAGTAVTVRITGWTGAL